MSRDLAIHGVAGAVSYVATCPLENLKFLQTAKSTLNDKCDDNDLPDFLQTSAPVFGPFLVANVVKEKGIAGLFYNNFISPMQPAGLVIAGMGRRISMGIWGFVASRAIFNKDGSGMVTQVLRDATAHSAIMALWFPLVAMGIPDKLKFYASFDEEAVNHLKDESPKNPRKNSNYAGFLTYALGTVVYHGALRLLNDKFPSDSEKVDYKKMLMFRVVAGLAAYPIFSIAERQRFTKEAPAKAAQSQVGKFGVVSLYNGFVTHYVKEFASEMLYQTVYEAIKAQLS